MTTVEKLEAARQEFVGKPGNYTTEELLSIYKIGRELMQLAAIEIAEGTEL